MLSILFVTTVFSASSNKPVDKDVLLDALVAEIQRNKQGLKGEKDAPLYYLSYRVTDGENWAQSASFGSLEGVKTSPGRLAGRVRMLDVSIRMGSPKLDNTHKVRGGGGFFEFEFGGGGRQIPIDDDEGALRVSLWKATDDAYREAAKAILKVKANVVVKVEDEDKAADFSDDKPNTKIDAKAKPLSTALDQSKWPDVLKRLSAAFKSHPNILRSSVSLQASSVTSYFVDSDGAKIREPRFFVRLAVWGSVRADDGMELDFFDDAEATSIEALPTEEEFQKRVDRVIERLEALRKAPAIEPYAGPAIVTHRAAGVFFHEIFGHRIEGHRQKDSDEGHTFTKKVGQRIVPEFISVTDDPTRRMFDNIPLNGFYMFDEEGQPAQKVNLVENGVLKSFLMGRSPIAGFGKSNGHGRAQQGLKAVSRQGNLLVDSSKKMPFNELRNKLIEEVKARGKPYGLLFEEISGGFTITRTGGLPQAFKVIPQVVYRVYPDGRPDELVRGVDVVGTPIASFERIIATGDDFRVFNGFCGAESGWVPVSAVAPSILISDIEVERKAKGQERAPLLPPPAFTPGPGKEVGMILALLLLAAPAKTPPPEKYDDPILQVIADEVARAMTLKMEKADKPYYARAYVNQDWTFTVWANFGAQHAPTSGQQVKVGTAVRVGTPDLDNTNFQSGGFSFGEGRFGQPAEVDLDTVRRTLWLQFDGDYKRAVESIARKRAYLETNQVKDRLPDFGAAPAEKVMLDARPPPQIDLDKWGGIVRRASAACRSFASPHSCVAGLQGRHGCQRLVASDGASHRWCETRIELYVQANGQAADGMPVGSDWKQWYRSEAEMPSEADLTAKVREMGELLEKKLKSQAPSEDYAGPVLFTAEAAPAFFLSALANPLSQPRESLGGGEQGRMIDKLGKHIAVSFLSATDDPTQATWTSPAGKVLPLFGYFPVDDDGVKPTGISLVKDGVLQTYYMSRLPTKRIKASNGHARNEQGSTGSLFVTTSQPTPLAALKKKLVELAKEEDMDYGLMVGRLPQSWESRPDTSLKLPNNPLLVWRVYADGREELVRGAAFRTTTFRVLKDIVAMGDDPVLLNTEQFGQQVSAVAPSTLVKLLELNRPRDEYGKPPVLPRPALPALK